MTAPQTAPKPQSRLREQVHFLRRLIASPRGVGAIAPSGHVLARAMVAQIDMHRSGPVLELGPGSGSMTREMMVCGLNPARLSVVERDPVFAGLIAQRFPGVRVIQGDALRLRETLAGKIEPPLAAVISGLPLLNFPQEARQVLVEDVLALLAPGAPFIQFSYGLHSPVAPAPGLWIKHAAFVIRNLPPAHVWVYRRGGNP